MRRGTTPATVLTVDMDLTGWTVYVAIRNGGNTLVVKDGLSVEYANNKTTIAFALTQEQTLAFSVGPCDFQVRAVKDGTAIATDIKSGYVGGIIQEGVIDE